MIWTEQDIRAELKRLDDITGLSGSTLPIVFGYARQTLGMFQFTRDGKPVRFRFSLHYLNDPNFSRAQALDTIRHEYAHYMNLMRNGKDSGPPHGEGWKQCCREIGASPDRCYNPAGNEVQLKRENAERALNTAIAHLILGMKLKHPAFGVGELIKVFDAPEESRLLIRFACGDKLLGAAWVFDNCTIVK